MKPAAKEVNVVQLYRHSHHCIAAMFAAGLTQHEVERRTGFSYRRLTILLADPTFQQLIAHYAKQVLREFADEHAIFHELRLKNAIAAELQIADHFEEAQDGDTLLKVRELLAISGNFTKTLPKELNVTVSFGDKLDAARERMARAKDITVIEGKALPAPQPASLPAVVSSPRTSPARVKRI